MRVEPVDSFAELVFHGLAHVPMKGVGSLFDPRYVAWSRDTLPEAAREPLATDAPAIGAQVDLLDAGLALQWLPRLHPSLDAFARTARRELAELSEADGCDATALRSLRSVDPRAVEWLRADLLLASRPFGSAREVVGRELREACDAIEAALSLAPDAARPESVRVAWALGAHGRGFDDGIVVGACAPWNGLDAATPAAIAMHEHAVLRATGDHAQREWTALASVARALSDGPHALWDAHTRWVASLELVDLASAAVARGEIDRRVADELLASPALRARSLARLTP